MLPVPRTAAEALAGDDAAEWQRAIDADPTWKIDQVAGQRRFYDQHVAPKKRSRSEEFFFWSVSAGPTQGPLSGSGKRLDRRELAWITMPVPDAA